MDDGDCTVEELLAAYASGLRLFTDMDLPDGADLSGCCLEGASFHGCFFFTDVNLKGANLRGTTFRRCNLKCSDLDDADLTDALIEECSVEHISARRSKINGLRVRNCGCYSSDSFDLDDFITMAVNAPEEQG